MYDTYNTLNNTLDTCYLYGIDGIPLIPGIRFQGSTNFDGRDISVGALTNMSYLFAESRDLSHIDNILNWDVSKVTNMGYMFAGCTNLVDLNISNWNVVNLQYVSNMFYGCNNLSNASIDSVINMCINATNIANARFKNMRNTNSYSPFYGTKISNARYANRWSDLTNAGWTY